MANIEIVYFSGMGHTAKQAEALAEGSGGRLWRLPEDGQLSDAGWTALDAADAIVFGSPTYMGGPAWQMKRVADESSARWFERKWQDKLAAGFTTSSSPDGDKGGVMSYFATLAAQHGMMWVSLGQAPAHNLDQGPEDTNWTGGSLGPVSVCAADSDPEQHPREGDLESARAFGQRLARIATSYRVLRAEDSVAAE
ncbi:MAG: flavodoxin family protein [Shimia sp.]